MESRPRDPAFYPVRLRSGFLRSLGEAGTSWGFRHSLAPLKQSKGLLKIWSKSVVGWDGILKVSIAGDPGPENGAHLPSQDPGKRLLVGFCTQGPPMRVSTRVFHRSPHTTMSEEWPCQLRDW